MMLITGWTDVGMVVVAVAGVDGDGGRRQYVIHVVEVEGKSIQHSGNLYLAGTLIVRMI